MEKQASIIVGCMRIGGKAGEEMNRFLHTALDNGLNWFDHADIYGGGRSEELLSPALSLRRTSTR